MSGTAAAVGGAVASGVATMASNLEPNQQYNKLFHKLSFYFSSNGNSGNCPRRKIRSITDCRTKSAIELPT